MISLSKIYCNKAEIFPQIDFHDGLNIIYSSVSENKFLSENHSHSVGKTTLVELIDFLFLKNIDKNHFLQKHKKIFETFIFYMQIKVSNSCFLTIERSISSKIKLKIHNTDLDARDLDFNSWDYTELGLKKARDKLSELCKLTPSSQLRNNFRKGLRYCFRKQHEFRDVFKVKANPEKASDWKPYLGELLGIEKNLIQKKFNIDNEIDFLKNEIKKIKTTSCQQEIEAEIQATTLELNERKSFIDSFNFQKEDQKQLKELVEGLDVEISICNRDQYIVSRKLFSIDKSLNAKFAFDIDQIKKLYEEIQLYLPEQLVKDYEDLINLNLKLTEDRNLRLEKTKKKLQKQNIILNEQLSFLDQKRSDFASKLLDEHTFERYKDLKSNLIQEEIRLESLESNLKIANSTSFVEKKLEDAKIEHARLTNLLQEQSKRINNSTITDIGIIFNKLTREFLNLSAYLYIEINENGNPEFKTKLHDSTSQDEGESYRQLISSCFDISLLIYYANQSFYRFVYHDGIFESINDNLKLNLLEQWRKIAIENKLQLIITLHDSDLPIDSDGKKLKLLENEIIRELHDRGDDGRLFKMSIF